MYKIYTYICWVYFASTFKGKSRGGPEGLIQGGRGRVAELWIEKRLDEGWKSGGKESCRQMAEGGRNPTSLPPTFALR